ncbi:hypothetical protein HDU78_002334 [Chytriomyces hyalinus]|nr:hypothetical protein HDU78_002334 [Chytriomyces hyalinus]
MFIETTSLSEDQIKISLLPIVFQREAHLAADPQLQISNATSSHLPPEAQLRKSAADRRKRSDARKLSIAPAAAASPSRNAPQLVNHEELDPHHLKGTEFWPFADGHGASRTRDVGAGWVPIYVSQCSLINNLLLSEKLVKEDDRHVIITDHHIHVTKAFIREKKDDYLSAFEFSIRISRIVDVQSGNSSHFLFQQALPEVIIQYQEMTLIKAPGIRIPAQNYSVSNAICRDSKVIIRTSQPHWKLPQYIKRAQTNSHIRSLFTTAAYHDSLDVDKFHRLEQKLIKFAKLNPKGSLKSHLKNIQHKAHIVKEIGGLSASNRAVKGAFWTSLETYKFLFDEIEAAFLIVKRFIEEQLVSKPRRRSEAQLAALVGLRNHPTMEKAETVSEEHALLLIRYLRRCTQLMTLAMFDVEQVASRVNVFRMASPYGFCDLIKISSVMIAGSTLESFLRGPSSGNIQHEKISVDTPKTVQGLAKLMGDLKLVRNSGHGSNASDIGSIREEQPPPPSAWASVPVRNMPGTRNGRSRAALEGTAAAFSSWSDARPLFQLSDSQTSFNNASASTSASNMHLSLSSMPSLLPGNEFQESSSSLKSESYSGYRRQRGPTSPIQPDDRNNTMDSLDDIGEANTLKDGALEVPPSATASALAEQPASPKPKQSESSMSYVKARRFSFLANATPRVSLTHRNSFETNSPQEIHRESDSVIYTGDIGRIDLWNARYHSGTKSAFRIQHTIDSAMKRENRRLQKEVADSLLLRSSLSSPRGGKMGGKVTFDVLDVTTLLSLPLPPLPPVRPPTIDPWEQENIKQLQKGMLGDLMDDDNDPVELSNQAAALLNSTASMTVFSGSTGIAFQNGYPSVDQFQRADFHPRVPLPRFESVHSSFLLAIVDVTGLLWELCFASQLDESNQVGTEMDILMLEQWVGSDKQKECGWFPAVGGLSVAMHFVVTVVCPDFNKTATLDGLTNADLMEDLMSENSERTENQEQLPKNEVTWGVAPESEEPSPVFSDLLPPRILVGLYRALLLIHHTVLIAGGSCGREAPLEFWEEEFEYVLTPKAVRSMFGHDARPISQAISDLLLQLITYMGRKRREKAKLRMR